MKIISRAPTRIGLLGGGTDVNPFASKYGGKVLSIGISLYHNVILVPRDNKQIWIENFGEVRELDLDKPLPNYGKDKNFDLIYAVINHFKDKLKTGFNLYDRFEGNHSSGLGSSGSTAVAIIGVFNQWLKLKMNKKQIAMLAWEMETKKLGWISGKQDQITATYGGINLLIFGPGNKFSVEPLKLSKKRKKEFEQWMLMCFTGGTRHSSILQQELKSGMVEKDKIKALLSLKKAVKKVKSFLEKGEWRKLGRLLDQGWEHKKQSNPAVTNKRIDYLYKIAKEQGALGGKIMGAGGEGHMFFLCSPEKKEQIKKVLQAEGVKLVNFTIDEQGLLIRKPEIETNYHTVIVREGFIPKQNWAVFLDRDGTINKETHLLHRIEDLEFVPQAVRAIKKLNKANIPIIVYHNASVVARGLCDENQIQNIHQYMIQELEKQKAAVDVIFYCPHHPTAFNLGYISDCSWRKPDSGMIKAAAKMFDFNLEKSYVIGDNARDILMGQKENCFSILVKTGHGGKDTLYKAKPDYIAQNILSAVNFILRRK